MTEGQGSAHCREEEIPHQLEAGGQLDKLLFASAWLLHFRERGKKMLGFMIKTEVSMLSESPTAVQTLTWPGERKPGLVSRHPLSRVIPGKTF